MTAFIAGIDGEQRRSGNGNGWEGMGGNEKVEDELEDWG
jgi:hypothetical protein